LWSFRHVDPNDCLTPSSDSGRLAKRIEAHPNGKIHNGFPRLSW
jgi:hypothetical protein